VSLSYARVIQQGSVARNAERDMKLVRLGDIKIDINWESQRAGDC
jgi:hypothetical protein